VAVSVPSAASDRASCAALSDSPSAGSTGPKSESPTTVLLTRLFAPVDIASLIFFRIGFGSLMAWWAWDYLMSGRVRFLYVEPRFHFTYYLFDWVRPWPGDGMYIHFAALAALGVAIACGAWYRLATLLFAAGFTYVFLLDATNYQNHYYLVLLLSWTLVLLPLQRAVSVDAARRRELRGDTAPAWALWLVRFHIGLPYVFGGTAKLNGDWFAGEPARQMLAAQATLPVIGPLVTSEWTVALVVWGGLLFDLTIVPLLLWRRTRAVGYALCVLFHVLNSVLFQIHIFPWFMIFASTMFFEPDWPRRLLGGAPLRLPPAPSVAWRALAPGAQLGVVLLVAYCLFHTTWPLRHSLYHGNASWTEQGHFFAWRMMLRGKMAGVRYYLTDPQTGQTWHPDLRPILNVDQAGRFSRDPEMILHLAHFLAAEHRRKTGHDLEVRALVLATLNGRKPQLLLDPSVDLARQPRGFHARPWVEPLTEPLRKEPWNVPLMEWERHVALPPLPAVKR
jgi:vitamin K-dependent gamma-carboxylase